MDNTPNLQLPYLIAAQAQKHVTHNEALRALDAVVQLSVLDRTLASAPASPSNGERYIVGPSALGDWLGKEGKIAVWQDNTWIFYSPREGWLCWIGSETMLVAWDGAAWNEVSASGSVNPAALVGVNAVADNTNKLAVKSDAVLFSHDDVTPGSGDIQATLNKATTSGTASFLFQDNWSGRAEIGLAGDDDFHFKVSPDGANWSEAIVIDRNTGKVSMPNNAISENILFNLLEDAGRFAGNPEDQGRSIGAFSAPTYFLEYNSAVFSGYDKFIDNNTTNGGSSGALDGEVSGLIDMLKNAGSPRRYGPEFWVMKIIAGGGTSGKLTIGGVDHYLTLTNLKIPLWAKSSWGINIQCLTGSMALKKSTLWETYVDGTLMSSNTTYDNTDGWQQLIMRGDADPRDSYDDNNGLFKIHTTPGAQILVALPFILPGWTTPKPGAPIGRVPSLTGWR